MNPNMKKEESVEKSSKPHHDSEEHNENENHLHQSTNSPSSPPHSLSNSSTSSISDDHHSATPVVPPIVPPLPPLPLVTAHRFQVEPEVVTKVDPGAEEGFVGVEKADVVVGKKRVRDEVLRSREIGMLSKVLLWFRITAFVFCLVSFSVLVADKEKGWTDDSFYLYKEFRYSLTVNVIGFVYSGLQMFDLVKYLNTRKHIVEHALTGYFTFALDQILTYLLMSASSSAATRAFDWESNWGRDKFPYMANASVALSFTAFVAFALASLVSGSIICRFR